MRVLSAENGDLRDPPVSKCPLTAHNDSRKKYRRKYRSEPHTMRTAASKPVKPSDLSIKALKPRAARYEVPVAGHRGLLVTVQPSGEKAWTYRTRTNGRLYREKLGTYPAMTLAAAQEAFGKIRNDRAKGVDLPARKQVAAQQARRNPVVSELCAEYLERHAKPRKRTWREDELMLNKDVLPAWGRLRAESIGRRDVTALVDSITDRGSPMQAGKVLALVRKVWNFGIQRGVLTVNPAARMPRPAPVKSRDRVLTDAEILAFWTHADTCGLRPQVAAALKVELLTGQRIGECLSVEWDELDLAAGTWLIPAAKSKNKREHLVPLTARAVELLDAQPRVSPFVFPARLDAARTEKRPIRSDVAAHELREVLRVPKGRSAKPNSLHAAMRDLRAKPFTSHDLRRTVETRMASLGIGREVRDRVLNHRDASVSGMHYNRHDYFREKRAALGTWESCLRTILDSTSPTIVNLRRTSPSA
jgi:integrase